MTNPRPAWPSHPAPPFEPPAPLALPAPTPAERMGAFGLFAGLTMGATVVGALLLLTLEWRIGCLTAVLVVADGLLWYGARQAFYGLQEQADNFHMRRAVQQAEFDNRQRAFDLTAWAFKLWGRRTFGQRQGRPVERVVLVRDGESRPTTTPAAPKSHSVPYSALGGQSEVRARVAAEPVRADDETRPLGELGGPEVWTPLMSLMQDMKLAGIDPTWENCKAYYKHVTGKNLIRVEWEEAKASFATMRWMPPSKRGVAARWLE